MATSAEPFPDFLVCRTTWQARSATRLRCADSSAPSLPTRLQPGRVRYPIWPERAVATGTSQATPLLPWQAQRVRCLPPRGIRTGRGATATKSLRRDRSCQDARRRGWPARALARDRQAKPHHPIVACVVKRQGRAEEVLTTSRTAGVGPDDAAVAANSFGSAAAAADAAASAALGTAGRACRHCNGVGGLAGANSLDHSGICVGLLLRACGQTSRGTTGPLHVHGPVAPRSVE
mmetsp:Transcript_61684/g.161578  ORF Transcript_61684/g.161578 Transcript_61684/m.161578 type:complete len:234 (-) Transcript_61684:96-797(-)